jgi:hypothetical protein
MRDAKLATESAKTNVDVGKLVKYGAVVFVVYSVTGGIAYLAYPDTPETPRHAVLTSALSPL